MAKGLNRALGSEVRARRRALNLSLEALAEEAGLDYNTIGYIERAETDPVLSSLIGVAKALGLPLSELFLHAERRLS